MGGSPILLRLHVNKTYHGGLCSTVTMLITHQLKDTIAVQMYNENAQSGAIHGVHPKRPPHQASDLGDMLLSRFFGESTDAT